MIDCPKLVLRLRTQQAVYEKADAFNLADEARQAADAIEELQKAICPHYIRNVHDRGDDSLCDKYKCEVNALPKWIPVTERLPEPGVPCLCWCKGGTYGQIIWYGLYYLTSHRTWAFYDNDCIDNREVTHWMYRPEPPKEEQI